MTTVRTPRGRAVHDTDQTDPTSTICGRPIVAFVVVDAPVTCKRCKRSRMIDYVDNPPTSNRKRSVTG